MDAVKSKAFAFASLECSTPLWEHDKAVKEWVIKLSFSSLV